MNRITYVIIEFIIQGKSNIELGEYVRDEKDDSELREEIKSTLSKIYVAIDADHVPELADAIILEADEDKIFNACKNKIELGKAIGQADEKAGEYFAHGKNL